MKHAHFCINWRGSTEEERKSSETRWVVLYTSYAGSVCKFFIASLFSSSNMFQITHASLMRLAVLRVLTSYTTSPVILKEFQYPTLPHQLSYKSSHILHYLTSRPTRVPISYTTSPVVLKEFPHPTLPHQSFWKELPGPTLGHIVYLWTSHNWLSSDLNSCWFQLSCMLLIMSRVSLSSWRVRDGLVW